jgi:hypothetical protein
MFLFAYYQNIGAYAADLIFSWRSYRRRCCRLGRERRQLIQRTGVEPPTVPVEDQRGGLHRC